MDWNDPHDKFILFLVTMSLVILGIICLEFVLPFFIIMSFIFWYADFLRGIIKHER